jgi:hypothetical protein
MGRLYRTGGEASDLVLKYELKGNGAVNLPLFRHPQGQPCQRRSARQTRLVRPVHLRDRCVRREHRAHRWRSQPGHQRRKWLSGICSLPRPISTPVTCSPACSTNRVVAPSTPCLARPSSPPKQHHIPLQEWPPRISAPAASSAPKSNPPANIGSAISGSKSCRTQDEGSHASGNLVVWQWPLACSNKVHNAKTRSSQSGRASRRRSKIAPRRRKSPRRGRHRARIPAFTVGKRSFRESS